MVLTAWSSFAWVRPVMITLAPSAASFVAIARPIPPVDPVTSAVLSLSCRSMAETPIFSSSGNNCFCGCRRQQPVLALQSRFNDEPIYGFTYDEFEHLFGGADRRNL